MKSKILRKKHNNKLAILKMDLLVSNNKSLLSFIISIKIIIILHFCKINHKRQFLQTNNNKIIRHNKSKEIQAKDHSINLRKMNNIKQT